MSQIHGQVFSPCFMTEEEFEAGYKNSVFYVEGDYMAEYQKHMVAMGHVANMAKVYILKNWEKVTDWSGLEVVVVHGPSGESTDYYNHENHVERTERRRKRQEKIDEGARNLPESLRNIYREMEEDDRARHNPIREFNSVVLDPTDGDFSITVNGDQEHWWIQDEAVIIIADYIEQQLKNKQNS